MFERGVRSAELRKVCVAALVGAMQMLSGAPEIIFLTWVITGVFWLVELVRGETSRWRFAGRFFAVLFLVAGLAAVQLLPFLDLLAHSQRSSHFGESQAEVRLPLTGILNYLVPLFHLMKEGAIFVQPKQYWTSSYYMGVGTVAFAVAALRWKRDWRTWTLVGLASFGLVMALGANGGLYAVLNQALPILGFMRFPVKFVVVATFVIPLLAAKSIAEWQSLPAERCVEERRKMIKWGGLFLAAIVLITVWEWASPMPQDDRYAVLSNALGRAIFLTLIFGCLLALREVAEKKLQLLLRWALILLVWFDVATHMPNLNPTVDRSVYNPDSVRAFFNWDRELRAGESRAYETRKSVDWVMYHTAPDAVTDVNGRRISLFANYNLLDHAAKLDGEYSLDMREMDGVWTKLYWSTNEPAGLEDFLGVARISNPDKPVDWLERKTHLPMITLGQEPVIGSDEDTLSSIFSPEYNPTQKVYLEPAARGQVTAQRSPAKVVSSTFQPQRLTAEVDCQASTMLVVAQAFYHNWQAYVDGKPEKLWRANYAFQALEIPSGKHEVILAYEDTAFQWGRLISGGSLVFVAVGLLWSRSARPA